MSVHEKLAARLREEWGHIYSCKPGDRVADWDQSDSGPYDQQSCLGCDMDAVASMFETGDFDDILGVREPTIEDVQRLALHVYGKHAAVRVGEDGLSIQVGTVVLNEPLYAPTIAAAYAALRTLEDFAEGK